MNKKDLLEKKVAGSPLNICFPEYTGKNTFEEVSDYIEQKFRNKDTQKEFIKKANVTDRLNVLVVFFYCYYFMNEKRSIYAHRTCATDTDNINLVFNDVADVVLKKQLREIALL